EFEHHNEESDDQYEKGEMTWSQVERTLNNFPMMVFDEELLAKAEEDAYQYFASKK
ncbi:hypothetical protein PIB30_088946, partial [Stylosanthes scabra]|nr:hypothetical protein [Stylosanthes scabra]